MDGRTQKIERSGFDLQQESSKKAGGSRKKTLARKRAGEKKSEKGAKRQKTEYEKEKEELRLSLKITPDDDCEVYYELLSRKYPIMIHTLFMYGTPMEINMLVEKKYPLIKEILKKMLSLQLEAEEESTMAFELIKFIKSLPEE
ncbi:hypothetical protein Tco_0397296 [Tanacetum coccineum]